MLERSVVLSNVARTRDADGLASDFVVLCSEHFLSEVNNAVACCLGTDERATPAKTLAGKNAGELVAQPLVLTEEETNLTTACSYVACGNVGVCADVLGEFSHEALAETHYLVVGLAFGVEVRTALATAHGECCEGVFEYLLESEEFQDAEVNSRVETEAAFVRSDCAVHLDAETTVDLDFALVVNPRNTEHDYALRLYHALEDFALLVLGVFVDVVHERFYNLLDSLVELGLTGILGDYFRHEVVDFLL